MHGWTLYSTIAQHGPGKSCPCPCPADTGLKPEHAGLPRELKVTEQGGKQCAAPPGRTHAVAEEVLKRQNQNKSMPSAMRSLITMLEHGCITMP